MAIEDLRNHIFNYGATPELQPDREEVVADVCEWLDQTTDADSLGESLIAVTYLIATEDSLFKYYKLTDNEMRLLMYKGLQAEIEKMKSFKNEDKIKGIFEQPQCDPLTLIIMDSSIERNRKLQGQLRHQMAPTNPHKPHLT